MIPCYIQNRDTLAVRQMVEKLCECEAACPVIVDSGSTYPPLLEWYKEASRNGILVVSVDPENHNKTAWATPERLPEPDGVYMASDGDLDISHLPRDFLLFLREQLCERSELLKIGCALQIADLPGDSPIAREVFAHESQFWGQRDTQCPLEAYHADIDTTLAVYRTGSGWGGYGPALRVAGPYTVQHIPWHLTRENITADWLWYFENLPTPKEFGLGWTPKLKRHFCGDATA